MSEKVPQHTMLFLEPVDAEIDGKEARGLGIIDKDVYEDPKDNNFRLEFGFEKEVNCFTVLMNTERDKNNYRLEIESKKEKKILERLIKGFIEDGSILRFQGRSYQASIRLVDEHEQLNRLLNTVKRSSQKQLNYETVYYIDMNRRQEQQDSIGYYYDESLNLAVWVVADGVSSQAKGKEASRYASQYVLNHVFSRVKNSSEEDRHQRIKGLISQAIRDVDYYLQIYYGELKAHGLIPRDSNDQLSQKYVATTIAVVALLEDSWYITNEGDTRVALLRDEQIRILSQESRETGTERLVFALGKKVGAPVQREAAYIGDLLLISSDGLIVDGLQPFLVSQRREGASNQKILQRMGNEAKKYGSDNIAAWLIDIQDESGQLGLANRIENPLKAINSKGQNDNHDEPHIFFSLAEPDKLQVQDPESSKPKESKKPFWSRLLSRNKE